MKRRLRSKLTYSNVIASIALFIALGGAAVAAGLPKNSVGTAQLQPGAVTTGKVGGDAIRAGKIAPGAIVGNRIRNEAVNTLKLKDEGVLTEDLGDGSVTGRKLADQTITTSKLADHSITAAKLAGDVPAMPTVLGSGETMRGQFDIGGDTTFVREGISYPVPVPTAAIGEIRAIGTQSEDCPGAFSPAAAIVPKAAPGHLCIYVALSNGEDPSLEFDYAANSALGSGVIGKFSAPDPSNRIFAFWAVTAP